MVNMKVRAYWISQLRNANRFLQPFSPSELHQLAVREAVEMQSGTKEPSGNSLYLNWGGG